jgi:riboflavin transporter FmnP
METKLQQPNRVFTTKFIASVGILAAASAVLMRLFPFPIPFLPPFLTFDFSDIPILIGAFAFGPITGLAIALIKDLICLFSTTNGGVGELADFITAAALLLPASIIYQRKKTRKNAVIGLLAGIVAMGIAGALANQFLLIPFFSHVMPLEQIFELCGKVNPFIKDTATYILYGAIPFNLIKGVALSAITILIYKKIAYFLHK